MARLVLAHPVMATDERPEVLLRLFGPVADSPVEELRFHSAAYLVAGVLALGMTGQDVEELAPKLVVAASSVDAESLLQRQSLLRRRPFGPPVPPLPEWLDDLDHLIGSECFAGVVAALEELGRYAGDLPVSDARGISGLSATTVCPGSPLTIFGSGFGGLRKSDTRVYVPVTGGGCREAIVEDWSDSAVVVGLPPDVAPGCVGFVRGVRTNRALQQVTGELTACMGAVAAQWTRGFDGLDTPLVVCPPCLPGGQNRISLAGRPSINTFRFNSSTIEPNEQPVLVWNVSNASRVDIAGVGTGGPTITLPSPVPLSGSVALPPIGGLTPVVGRYRLTAFNSCGQATDECEFTMTRKPNLSVARIEIVQAIQKVDNSVRLTANRRTAVRVFVDSGIDDGFDLGNGPNWVYGVVASVYAERLEDGSVFGCGDSWVSTGGAGPGHDRNVLEDSINFDVPVAACHGLVRFRAVVQLPGPVGSPPQSWASGTVDVAFTPKSAQEMLPVLVTDPSVPASPPTMSAFFGALTFGPGSMQPFPAKGFVINPPLSLTLTLAESLTVRINWDLLILRLATTAILFSPSPANGIRAAIVPDDPAYPGVRGIAAPRVAVTIPSLAVRAWQPASVFAHELAHTYGLSHVNLCGGPNGPAGPYDSRLPLRISDPGLNVRDRTLWPAGTAETMSYCVNRWTSAEHWDAIFDRIPI